MEKVIIFSAPSGSGKTTLVQYVLQEFSSMAFSISCTTRQPRGTERNGQDYYFISLEEFQQKIQENEFVEYEEVYQNLFYGTLKKEVSRIWKQNKTVIFDVDVKGGISLKKYFGEKALSLFIMVPTIEELQKRLQSRGTDDEETIQMRVSKAKQEMSFKNQFDKIIINEELEVAQIEIKKIITDFLK